jgi:squalene-hopene/tetraprenyl-beta-curcumene cyclase
VSSWDPQAAAAYLDHRMQWWISWGHAARDHGTFCISCHTALSYALARPNLRAALAEPAPAAAERALMDDVTKRVRLWSETEPYYTDQRFGAGKSAQARGTEAVLNALILACADARTGRLSPDTRLALENMWAQQRVSGDDKGAWSWLNFNLAPWETPDAQYFGAAMAAMAAGVAPESYQTLPQVQEHLQLLREYLERAYPAQPLHHRLALLWGAAKLPGFLDAHYRQAVIEETLHAQNRDGGWSLIVLAPKPGKREWLRALLYEPDSDAYATGLATLVLEETAMPRARAEVQRGLSWLSRNQVGQAGWVAHSLNKERDPRNPVGLFMSDAATAYAVLALTEPKTADR